MLSWTITDANWQRARQVGTKISCNDNCTSLQMCGVVVVVFSNTCIPADLTTTVFLFLPLKTGPSKSTMFRKPRMNILRRSKVTRVRFGKSHGATPSLVSSWPLVVLMDRYSFTERRVLATGPCSMRPVISTSLLSMESPFALMSTDLWLQLPPLMAV